MHHLTILRKLTDDDSTVGKLYVNGLPFCYTLEDEIREIKVKHETAIPTGMYRVSVTYSPNFQKLTPFIHDVPGFEYIRIHTGNDDDDTSGCVLVGMGLQLNERRVTKSRVAFDALMNLLHGESEIWLTVLNDFDPISEVSL